MDAALGIYAPPAIASVLVLTGVLGATFGARLLDARLLDARLLDVLG